MRALSLIVTALILFGLGFAWRDLQSGRPPDPDAFGRLVGLGSRDLHGPEQEFRQAYNRILATYYRPVTPQKLKYAGIGGMMASLGDPHTMFLEPQVAKRFNMDTTANYVGIGARLSQQYDRSGNPLGARVVVVFENGPAYAAGLRRGDVIVAVEGKRVGGSDIDDIVRQILGEEGTKVHLSVMKAGKGQPVPIAVLRSHVITPTVESEYLRDSGVGYVYIASFSAPTADQFDKELEKLEQYPLKGLVIDVRNDPGGYLDTAVDLLSRFRANKIVVSMKMRDGSVSREVTASNLVHPFTYPVVVLINGDSASAAEIFAGALRDYKVATLVGVHSYGKASVQEVYPFKDGSSGKITIARYYLPLGSDISRKVDEDGSYLSGGLEPDVKVEFEERLPDELTGRMDTRTSDLPDPATDNQLRRAVEVVLAKAG